MEDENALMRKTVAELKKRVDDLQATNEFLLEQNAQMRLNDKAAAAASSPAAITNGHVQNQLSDAIRTSTAPASIAAVQTRRFEPIEHFVGQQLWVLDDFISSRHENDILHQTVAELKNRVDDLQATNEYIEQNVQMLLNNKGTAT